MKKSSGTVGIAGCGVALVVAPVLVLVVGTWRVCGSIWDARRTSNALRRTLLGRDVLAVCCVVGANIIWRWGHIDAGKELNDSIGERAESIAIILAIVTLACWAFVAITKRGRRVEMMALATIPLLACGAIVLLLGIFLMIALPSAPLHTLFGWIDEMILADARGEPGGQSVGYWAWQVAKIVGGLGLALAGGAIFVAALVKCLRSQFRARDAHPLLEPVTAICLATYALARGILGGLTTVDVAYPPWVAWLLTFCGPTVVVALSLLQIHHLRARVGVTFRLPAFNVDDDPISSRAFRVFAALGRRRRGST